MHETIGDDFIQAFVAKAIDMTTSSWEEYFAALERYKAGEGKGDPNCPQSYVTNDTTVPLNLGVWLLINDEESEVKGLVNY